MVDGGHIDGADVAVGGAQWGGLRNTIDENQCASAAQRLRTRAGCVARECHSRRKQPQKCRHVGRHFAHGFELLMVDDGHRSSGILFRFGHARGANHHIVKLESGVLQMALRLHLQRHEQRKAC